MALARLVFRSFTGKAWFDLKRLCVFSFVVALLFLLAVPAAAAMDYVEKRGFYEKAIALYEPPAGYPYYMVLHENHFTGNTNINFYASKTPIIQEGDTVIETSYRGADNLLWEPKVYENVRVAQQGGKLLLFYHDGGQSHGGGVFIKDVSTADFYNRQELTAGYPSLVAYYYENVDLSELEALVAQAEAIENDDYTSLSWSIFESAVYKGKAVLAKMSPRQAEVDVASNDLRSAIQGLVKVSAPETPSGPSDHRYLIDGFRPEDLLPAENAIMENLGQGRKFGLFVFGAMIVILILVRVIKKFLESGFSGDTRKYEKHG